MITLRSIVAVALVTLALRAQAVPFHACTFFKPTLVKQSMLCADFRVTYGACRKIKCFPGGCYTYDGALVTGWMPDYFLEVTNRAGQSAFASADFPAMKAAMGIAAGRWASHGILGDLPSLSATTEARQGDHHSMFFGRALQVPFGPVGWRLQTASDMNTGTMYPKCYKAVTEFAAETWADDWSSSGDRELATAWAAYTAPVCAGGAAVMGALATLPRPSVPVPSFGGCALRPLSVPEQKAAAVTGSATYDITKQCMGGLGGLLPRTGFTDGSTYDAAERIAWRTASLAEDYFKAGVGVEPSDKWQIVHPASTGFCFPPGSALRPSPLLGGQHFGRLPPLSYDNLAVPQHETDYVFAVWRFRSTCVEPLQHWAVEGEIAAYELAHTAACAPINAATGAP